MLWSVIQQGQDALAARAMAARGLAAYTKARIEELRWPTFRHRHAFTVVLRTPPAGMAHRWVLPAVGGWSHVIAMPGVTREQIDAFVADLAEVIGDHAPIGRRAPQPGFGSVPVFPGQRRARRAGWNGNARWVSADGVPVWHMHIHPVYADLIAAGVKTVELRAARWSRRELAVGNLIRFHSNETDNAARAGIMVRVQRVTDYITEGDLLDQEDPATILGPGATGEDVAAVLDTLYPDAPPGYLAIEMELIGTPAGADAADGEPAGGG